MHIARSSCGNRHCPVCQHEKAVKWVYQQQLRLLPCNYFLVTFTLPDELRALARSNQSVVYKAMFDAASESLRTLEADKRFVGCKVPGFFGVLHTWGRQLQYHPHIHFVVPGGGLTADRSQWVAARGNFLVHVRALSKMYRGKLQKALRQAGLLEQTPASAWSKDWVVDCENVGDGAAVMKYLGAYVMRVAISAARMTIDVFEFMRRFLQHVLPKGFMKIRHYGMLSPNFSVPLEKIRQMICSLHEALRKRLRELKPPQRPKPLRCPKCCSIMKWWTFLPPLRWGAAG